MHKLPEGEYAMYLRKSRKDIEAEARGQGDTLENHRRNLFELAKRYGISITEIYPEVVTGERVSARPEMQRLLEDVENERWKGVLVMEVERLARGDTMDQGLVAQTFKFAETLIVTPMRIYNPNDPNDEEYFEFGLFMSRREFKTITRRLQWGRQDAVKQGRYVGNIPPYGYARTKLEGKGYSLVPNKDESLIVKLIFDIYTSDDLDKRKGTPSIAEYLNDMRIPSRKGTGWITSTIRDIIKNPVYAGYVRWGWRRGIKQRDGSIERPIQPEEKWIVEKGLHQALVDEETFQKAQEIMNDNARPPVEIANITNPFAGILRCDMCGGSMIYRPLAKQPPTLICTKKACSNVGSYFHLVEERILVSLKEWLKSYKAQWKSGKTKQSQPLTNAKEAVMKSIERELEGLQKQKGNLHDLLEKGVYTTEVYLERSQNLSQRITEASEALEIADKEYEKEKQRETARVDIIPRVEQVIKLYPTSTDPAEKNALLRSVIEVVHYRKEKGGRWHGLEDKFTLSLYPKLPK